MRVALVALAMFLTACGGGGGAGAGAKPGGFAPRLDAAERTLKKLKNYRSYLACGFEHCALPTAEFYSQSVDGVRLRDWVADLAAGRDVECPVCRR